MLIARGGEQGGEGGEGGGAHLQPNKGKMWRGLVVSSMASSRSRVEGSAPLGKSLCATDVSKQMRRPSASLERG